MCHIASYSIYYTYKTTLRVIRRLWGVGAQRVAASDHKAISHRTRIVNTSKLHRHLINIADAHTISHRYRIIITSVSHRYHNGITPISDRYHNSITSVPCRYHIDTTSVSRRYRNDFTSISHPHHTDITSVSQQYLVCFETNQYHNDTPTLSHRYPIGTGATSRTTSRATSRVTSASQQQERDVPRDVRPPTGAAAGGENSLADPSHSRIIAHSFARTHDTCTKPKPKSISR